MVDKIYPVADFTTSGGVFNPARLCDDIVAAAIPKPSLVPVLRRKEQTGEATDDCFLRFESLTAQQESDLSQVIAAHDGVTFTRELAPRRMSHAPRVITSMSAQQADDPEGAPDKMPMDGIIVIRPQDPHHIMFDGAFTPVVQGIRIVDAAGNALGQADTRCEDIIISPLNGASATLLHEAVGVPMGERIRFDTGSPTVLQQGRRCVLSMNPMGSDRSWWAVQYTA